MNDFTECAAPEPGTLGIECRCVLGKGHVGPCQGRDGRTWTGGLAADRLAEVAAADRAVGGPAAEERDREGRRVARRVALWHIGDPEWADTIIDAYLNPNAARKRLEQEKNDDA